MTEYRNGIEQPIFRNLYGEMKAANNATAQVLETANTPICLRNIVTGSLSGFSFDAGSTAAITAYADYSGTVAGAVQVTSAAHGLVTGDIVSIRGTTNYNGIFQITKIDANNFYIMDTWVADDGASDWDQPGHLIVSAGSNGKYLLSYSLSIAEAGAGGSQFSIQPYVNTTVQTNVISKYDAITTKIGTHTKNGVLTLSDNDNIFLALQSNSTNNVVVSYLNLSLQKLI